MLIILPFGRIVNNHDSVMGFDKKAFWCYNSGMVRTAVTGDGRGGWALFLKLVSANLPVDKRVDNL